MRTTAWLRTVVPGILLGLMLGVGSTAARPTAIPAGNLIVNPGAEDSPGTANDLPLAPPAGWTTTGNLTVWLYGSQGDRPDKAFAASIGGGANLFSGGPGAGAPGGKPGQPTARQSIDVSAAATEIDAAGVAATLKGFIGGYTTAEDFAQVDALFYDAAGTQLPGRLRIGPVTMDDRKKLTTLLERSAVANVPTGTRRIDVVISVTPDSQGKNSAFVDNLSLTLGKAAPAMPTLTVKCSGKTLVATVQPATGSVVSSVTFLVNGKPVALDKKAPFSARIGTAGLPAQLKVTARVNQAGKTIELKKTIRRC